MYKELSSCEEFEQLPIPRGWATSECGCGAGGMKVYHQKNSVIIDLPDEVVWTASLDLFSDLTFSPSQPSPMKPEAKYFVDEEARPLVAP